MPELAVTSKGQVTIPKAVRQQLGIRAGSKVQFTVVDDHAEMQVVHTLKQPPRSGAGMLKYRGPHCPDDFDVATLLQDQKPD